jgi:hypothetical protein
MDQRHASNELRRRADVVVDDQPTLPRLDRPQRAGYLSEGIHRVVNVCMCTRPDTLEHVLMICPALQAERDAMRARLYDQSHGSSTELCSVSAPRH